MKPALRRRLKFHNNIPRANASATTHFPFPSGSLPE